jgi:hypothetical protein
MEGGTFIRRLGRDIGAGKPLQSNAHMTGDAVSDLFTRLGSHRCAISRLSGNHLESRNYTEVVMVAGWDTRVT